MVSVYYRCHFPGGRGLTCLKSIADKIYALSMMLPDDDGDDSNSPREEVSSSLDQGDQHEDLIRHDTDGSLVIVVSEQGDGGASATIASGQDDEDASVFASSPLKTAPGGEKTADHDNAKYAVIESWEPLPEELKQMDGPTVDFLDGWVTEKLKKHIDDWEKKNGTIDTAGAPEKHDC